MSGINIECKARQILPLGSHDMFIGEVVGIDVSEEYIGENGLVNLDGADLIAHSSRKLPNNVPAGGYVKPGETIGRYGFTAGKDDGMALPPGRMYEPISGKQAPRMVRRLEGQWKKDGERTPC